MTDRVKFLLAEDDIPDTWQNVRADLPGMAPVLDARSGTPLGRAAMARTMAEPLAEQEMSDEPEFEIPEPVRQLYAQWRPTPLYRARGLERALDTPAHIY